MTSPHILVFDIEAAGVQGLKADRGVMTHFGYHWLGSRERVRVPAIHDYNGWKTKSGLDDTGLLREVSSIVGQADGLIAHFGEYFDRPYVDSRLARIGLPIIPEARLTDTCLIAKKRLCLSSNRLANLAEFFQVPTKKMEKGRGWPDWWMGALYGHVPSLESMRTYCAIDVECLEQLYLRMRAVIPMRQLPVNLAIGQQMWTCPRCGGHRKTDGGSYYSNSKRFARWRCLAKGCGGWTHSSRALDVAPKL